MGTREDPIHRSILAHLRLRLPDAVIFHPTNELNMGGPRRRKAIVQGKAIGLGMLPGMADLVCCWRGRFLAIEVKAESALTDAQKTVGRRIQDAGGFWGVARSINEADALIEAWAAEMGERIKVKTVVLA